MAAEARCGSLMIPQEGQTLALRNGIIMADWTERMGAWGKKGRKKRKTSCILPILSYIFKKWNVWLLISLARNLSYISMINCLLKN